MPDIVHLHDSVFPEEENIKDIPLDENYDYNRDNPYYATDPETWWWNKKNYSHIPVKNVFENIWEIAATWTNSINIQMKNLNKS